MLTLLEIMDKNTNHKVLAVASKGGHWMQLLRICGELEKSHNIVYISTDRVESMLPEGATLHVVNDFNRWNAWKLLPTFWQIWKVVGREKPRAIITTGAAPGLVAILAGRLRGVRTLWVDSIANAAELSGSGRVARRLAHRIFTQWPHLAHGRVEYHGNALGLNQSPTQKGGESER